MDVNDNSKERNNAVMTARLLGFGGLLPFVILAAATMMGLHTPFAPAHALLIGYGAVILSFVGALHWGAQLSAHKVSAHKLSAGPFIWSVVPALIGWVALMLPAKLGALCLIGGLVMCWGYDMRLIRKKEWPSFMGALRTILTAIACLSLSVIFFAV